MTPEQRTRRMKLNMLMAMSYAAFAGSRAFTPATLFASGEQGVWYDPSDFSTMFQDSAGTTPVTAVGDPVGKILDKSGRGNHATQGTSASRPVLQQDSGGRYYLSFDGTDDSLATSSITPGVDKAQVFAGLRVVTSTTSIVAELSTSVATNNGSFALLNSPVVAGVANPYPALRGDTALNSVRYTGKTAPATSVITAQYDIAQAAAADEIALRVDGAAGSVVDRPDLGPAGGGNFGSYPLYIGRRGGSTLPFNGRIYGLVVRFGANLSSSQISSMETWMNARTGAY